MEILLIGEYSRLHNSLKEGLAALGHEAHLLSTGDDFKDYPSDTKVSSILKNNFISKFTGKIIYKLFKFNIFQEEIYFKTKKIVKNMSDFDVIQFINQDPFNLPANKATKINDILFANNKKAFLLACGEDSYVIDYYARDYMRYSILTPLLLNPELEKDFEFSLKYIRPEYKKNYEHLIQEVQAIIPTDFDYAIPYASHPKASQLIPTPINIDKIKFKKLKIKERINIFHGINRGSYYKKGTPIVEEALKELQLKYPDKINIIYAENIPYNEYKNLYNDAHIFIDQLYSYDQGYNALEAMASGKCVITGFEKEDQEYYNMNTPAINGAIDPKELFSQLEELILNPERIIEIGKNARQFVEEKHHYKKIAQEYLKLWQNQSNF